MLVNVFAGTSIVQAPFPLGVNLALYIVSLSGEKLLKDPPVTVIEPSTKPVAYLFDVNCRSINELSLVDPFDTPLVVQVITILISVSRNKSRVSRLLYNTETSF